MSIRPETSCDHAAIARLLDSAFPGPDEARLVENLRRDGDAAIALVAEEDGVVVGHVMLSAMAAPAPLRALGLAPLAVAEAHRRRGIGAALVRAALAQAAAQGWHAVFVLGEPAYYRRFGFAAAVADKFTSPYAGPYLLAVALHPMPIDTGRIYYAPAFAALG